MADVKAIIPYFGFVLRRCSNVYSMPSCMFGFFIRIRSLVSELSPSQIV